jgi:hypothetical protein
MTDSGTELSGFRLVFLPIRALVEFFFSGSGAFDSALHCASNRDYRTALRLFEVAERKFKRKGPSDSDGVLASLAGQARCQLELGRPDATITLASTVLGAIGSRTTLRGIKRSDIESYKAHAEERLR